MKNTILSLSTTGIIPTETVTAILAQWTILAQLVEDAVFKKVNDQGTLTWNLRIQTQVTEQGEMTKFNSFSTVNLCTSVEMPTSGGIHGEAAFNHSGLAVASSCSEVMIYPDCVYWHDAFPNQPIVLAEQLTDALTSEKVERNGCEYSYCASRGLLASLKE